MQQIAIARRHMSVPGRKALHNPAARRALKAAVPGGIMLASTALGQSTGEISQSQFTELATKVLSYLGYAIAAGLTVLVAVIAAQAGWRFFGKFIKA